jgi:hypothetical protein
MEPSKLNGHTGQAETEEFFSQPEPLPNCRQELDLDEYRSGQSLDLANITAQSAMQKIEVRRPKKKEWFRCPAAETLERVWLMEGDGISEFYLVRKDVVSEFPDEFTEAYLALCINPAGRLFLWPIKCGSEGGQEFTESALAHVSQARANWIRRKWVGKLKAHRVDVGDMEDQPEWPDDIDMRSIITRAFGDRVIRSLDHPLLRFVRK